jgi:hypothetical protein
VDEGELGDLEREHLERAGQPADEHERLAASPLLVGDRDVVGMDRRQGRLSSRRAAEGAGDLSPNPASE